MRLQTKLDVADALSRLDGLKQTVRGKIARKAVTAAGKPMAKSLKGRVARSKDVKPSGTLARAVASISRTYRNSGTSVAIIGPRRGFAREVVIKPDRVFRVVRGRVVRIVRPTPEQLRQKRDPVRYAHLVMKQAMQRTFDAGKREAEATVGRVIAAEVDKLKA